MASVKKRTSISSIVNWSLISSIVEWSSTELNQLDVKFRKLFSMNGVHYLKADIDHLYLPRHLGRRGFVSLLDVVECEKQSLSYYLHGAT